MGWRVVAIPSIDSSGCYQQRFGLQTRFDRRSGAMVPISNYLYAGIFGAPHEFEGQDY
jgi:hypothetical protein